MLSGFPRKTDILFAIMIFLTLLTDCNVYCRVCVSIGYSFTHLGILFLLA